MELARFNRRYSLLVTRGVKGVSSSIRVCIFLVQMGELPVVKLFRVPPSPTSLETVAPNRQLLLTLLATLPTVTRTV